MNVKIPLVETQLAHQAMEELATIAAKITVFVISGLLIVLIMVYIFFTYLLIRLYIIINHYYHLIISNFEGYNHCYGISSNNGANSCPTAGQVNNLAFFKSVLY